MKVKRTKWTIIGLTAAALWIGGLLGVDWFMESVSKQAGGSEVAQIASFTLKGCGGCTEALNEVRKAEEDDPARSYLYYDILNDTDAVNRYVVKEHPTVLFLNEDGAELGRLEKQITSEEIERMLGELSGAKPIKQSPVQDEQVPGSVLVKVYAHDPVTGRYVAVSQFAEADTLVRYPKIAALQTLFSIHDDTLPSQLEGAIPANIDFLEIRSEGTETIIEVSDEYSAIAESKEGARVREAIALTLAEFKGVEAIRVVTSDYRSDVITASELSKLIDPSPIYTVASDGFTPPAKGIEAYNAAILHGDELAYIPCFCGCGSAGHTSNRNCYFSDHADGTLQLTNHGEYCQVCLDITAAYLEAKKSGADLSTIRSAIDQAYSDYTSTDTPYPI